MSEKKKSLGFLPRVIRALGDSKPNWWNRLFAAVLALLILAGCGIISKKWAAAGVDLIRSIWWEKASATLVENYGQTAIRYSYEIERETFSGTQFSFGDTNDKLMEQQITQFLDHQQSDNSFLIFVNPDVEGEAVIQRSLAPNTLMLIPLSLVLLGFGIMLAGYAVLPSIAYWWRRKLRRQFIGNTPELIVNSLTNNNTKTKLLFSSMALVHRGIRLLVWSGFWILIVLLGAIGGGILMIKLGDLRWIYFGLGLVLVLLISLIFGWMIFRRVFGLQPPGLVFFFNGWSSKSSVVENEKVSVRWMSDPDEKDNFRSCRFGLGRWKNGQSFSRWRKNYPDWRDTLIDISRGSVGAHSFELESVDHFDGPVTLGEEVHLVMIWQEWDGKVHQTSIYLGRICVS